MKLIKSEKANINYLAKIVDIQKFHAHPDSEVTKLKCTYVDGYEIIVGIDSEPGKYVYFPTSSRINYDFLSFANLYRHSEKNADPNQKGMFEDNGRVKAIRLRGCLSEGFLIPLNTLINWIVDSTQLELNPDDLIDGFEFDSFEHNGKTVWINKKYVVQRACSSNTNKISKYQKHLKRFDRLIDGQFRLHYETSIIKKLQRPINPYDLIHISSKIHGTSFVSGYVLVKQPINIFKRLCNWFITHKWSNYIPVYDYIYSSRTVIKNKYINKNSGPGYYDSDIWGEAHKYVIPSLQKGMTMYGEIVGFTPNGRYIQKNYDYGCVPPKEGESYTPEKHFKVRIYRITVTNVDGDVHEFSPWEVQIYCRTHNLIPVEQLYYGYAKDLYPELHPNNWPVTMDLDTWNREFIEHLANDKNFYMELNSPDCNNEVPHEGIVIKIDNMKSFAMKLKCFNFLNKEQQELDKGESNIEDEN